MAREASLHQPIRVHRRADAGRLEPRLGAGALELPAVIAPLTGADGLVADGQQLVRRVDIRIIEARIPQSEGGVPVALFRRADQRRQAVAVARRAGAAVRVVECVAPEAVVRQRLEHRVAEGTGASDAGWQVYEEQRSSWEPVTEVPAGRHIRLDTSGTSEETAQALLQALFHSAIVERPGPPWKG